MNAKRDIVNGYKERYGRWMLSEILLICTKRDMVDGCKERYGKQIQREVW